MNKNQILTVTSSLFGTGCFHFPPKLALSILIEELVNQITKYKPGTIINIVDSSLEIKELVTKYLIEIQQNK